MCMSGKLKRLKSSHQNLRTDEVEGEYAYNPEVGKVFILIGESLSFKGGKRWIETTPVKTVEQLPDRIRFTTLYSTYELYEVKPQ